MERQDTVAAVDGWVSGGDPLCDRVRLFILSFRRVCGDCVCLFQRCSAPGIRMSLMCPSSSKCMCHAPHQDKETMEAYASTKFNATSFHGLANFNEARKTARCWCDIATSNRLSRLTRKPS